MTATAEDLFILTNVFGGVSESKSLLKPAVSFCWAFCSDLEPSKPRPEIFGQPLALFVPSGALSTLLEPYNHILELPDLILVL